MANKCVLVLLDGIGDRSQEELGWRTPLQAAHTPVLDDLAVAAACGSYHAGRLGQCLPSESAHFALFGYRPEEFPGRGPLEARGSGVAIGPGQVAGLARFVSLEVQDGVLYLADPKPRLLPAEVAALLEAVGHFEHEGVSLRLAPKRDGSAVLVLSGAVSPAVTDTNVMRAGAALPEPCPWAEAAADPAARGTASALKAYHRWAYGVLSGHPLNRDRTGRGLAPYNGVVTQRLGRSGQLESLAERTGLRGASVASGEIYWGLAETLGMGVERCDDSADPGADLAARLGQARGLLRDYDFVHVHTKAPDEAAHRKDPAGKRAVIEALDDGLGRGLRELRDDPEILLVVASDHSTPSDGPLVHSGESVPLLVRGTGVRRDAVSRFDEVSVVSGSLGAVRGPELMCLILGALGRAKLQGVRDVPEDRCYWPGVYVPLTLGPDADLSGEEL